MKNELGAMMKQVQAMQEKMQEAQKNLAYTEVTGESGAGAVKITMTCDYTTKRVDIDSSMMDDKEMLEDLVAAAINDVMRRIQDESSTRMSGLTSGMGLPPGFKMPF